MKNILPIIILVLLNMNCKVSKNDTKSWAIEREKVEKCRNNWEYKTSENLIEITIIEFQKKSYYTSNSFPNFFIGTTSNKDTIGILEYDTNRIFKKGDVVKFEPEPKRNQFNGRGSLRDYPIYTVSEKPKENNLLCSIKTIFYGKIKEDIEK